MALPVNVHDHLSNTLKVTEGESRDPSYLEDHNPRNHSDGHQHHHLSHLHGKENDLEVLQKLAMQRKRHYDSGNKIENRSSLRKQSTLRQREAYTM